MKSVKVAIFASGTGSNAMALCKKAQSLSTLDIAFVLSDKAAAPVLGKAQDLGIKTYLIEKKKDRTTHESEVLQILREHHIDWILLAGYMRLISPHFLQTFSKWHGGASQIVNIHPSVLPAYPGVDSIARAHQDRVSSTGVTIHLVDEGTDTGPILKQESIPLNAQDPVESWAQKIHELEHRMYTDFLESLATGSTKTFYFEETH